jgi:arylsulfatase A-like enzyme
VPKPDYQGGSLANLMSSLVQGLGGPAPLYPPLRDLPPDKIRAARNVVLIVLDALGHGYLTRNAPASALARHLVGRVTSVFPATTATAITTFLTGEAPQQHGLTGWHMYLRELGVVATVLPFRARYGGPSLSQAGVSAAALFGHMPVFDRMAVASYAVAPERIIDSDFNAAHRGSARRRPFRTLKEFFQVVAGCLREGGERKYVYAYYPELDSLAHDHGAGSRAVAAHFAEVDAAFTHFLKLIQGTDTLVIVTADHGVIDSDASRVIELDQHPELAETLRLPLCGERRVAYCYVRADRRAEFERYVALHLGAYAELFPSARLVAEDYFGIGPPHPRLAERIGDYTLIMKENYQIKDWLFGESRHVHLGVHGGLSDEEMYVPLVLAHA